MPATYVVRRLDAYHFRLRVPAELVPAIGRRELHSSLGHSTRKAASNRASYLAFHAHAFFARLRRTMTTMTSDQIAALVADWRRRMFQRDGDIRRLIELDEHETFDRDSYADHCESVAGLAEETLERLVSLPQGVEGTSRPSRREQDNAATMAVDLMTTDEADSDHVPLMTRAEFEQLDRIDAKDVARQFLLAMGQVYNRKAAMCGEAFASGAASAPVSTVTAPPEASPAAATSMAQVPTIGEAWGLYVASQAKRGGAWKGGRIPDNDGKAWATFSVIMGVDAPVTGITPQSLLRYERIEERLPNSRVKPYAAMPMAELIGLAERGEVPNDHLRASQTLMNRMAAIRGFVRYCASRHGVEVPQAFEFRPGGRVRDDEDTSYEPWTPRDLALMFDPDALGAYVRKRRTNALRRLGESTAFRDGSQWKDWPWFILLALYTGARLSELVGLRAEDVLQSHPETKTASGQDVPVIRIVPYAGRRLKNKASTRCVPIHPDLIRMGFLELASARRDRGTARLLDSAGTIEKGGGHVSDALKAHAEALGARQADDRKVFHSFRHTFKTAALGCMLVDHADGLVGHKGTSDAPSTYRHGEKIPQHDRAASLARVTFGLDVEGLRLMLEAIHRGAE